MSDWNDVLTVLNHDPAIRSWAPVPGTTRTAHATITTETGNEVSMIIDNSANEYWLQLLTPITVTSEGRLWETAGQALRNLPAIGLTQHGAGIAIRHGILLPHAGIHAITNGITLTAIAATTHHETTQK